MGNQFLPGTTFSVNGHRRIRLRSPFNDLIVPLHGSAFPHHSMESFRLIQYSRKLMNLLVFLVTLRNVSECLQCSKQVPIRIFQQGGIFHYRHIRTVLLHHKAPSVLDLPGRNEHTPFFLGLGKDHLTGVTLQDVTGCPLQLAACVPGKVFHGLIDYQDGPILTNDHKGIVNGLDNFFVISGGDSCFHEKNFIT